MLTQDCGRIGICRLFFSLFQGSWNPSSNLCTLLTMIQQLLGDPNPDDGLSAEVTKQFKENRIAFDAQAREMTRTYATLKQATNMSGEKQKIEEKPNTSNGNNKEAEKAKEGSDPASQANAAASSADQITASTTASSSTTSPSPPASPTLDTPISPSSLPPVHSQSTSPALSPNTVSGNSISGVKRRIDENELTHPLEPLSSHNSLSKKARLDGDDNSSNQSEQNKQATI